MVFSNLVNVWTKLNLRVNRDGASEGVKKNPLNNKQSLTSSCTCFNESVWENENMIDGLFHSRYMSESVISKLRYWGFSKIKNGVNVDKTRTERNTTGRSETWWTWPSSVSTEVRVSGGVLSTGSVSQTSEFSIVTSRDIPHRGSYRVFVVTKLRIFVSSVWREYVCWIDGDLGRFRSIVNVQESPV